MIITPAHSFLASRKQLIKAYESTIIMGSSNSLTLPSYLSSTITSRPTSPSTLLQVPPEQPPEHGIPVPFHHIPMARNNPLKPPIRNPLCTLRKPLLILRHRIPQKPLLPLPINIRKVPCNLVQNPRQLPATGPTKLLLRRQIEQQIRLDQRVSWFVQKHDLFIRMPVKFVPRVSISSDMWWWGVCGTKRTCRNTRH